MNKLSTAKRVQIVSAPVEGNSLRSVSRMADVSINTVTKLLVALGRVCADYHDRVVRGLEAQRIQCDEIWAFVGAKQKNVPEDKIGEWGDVWTWTAIDADSKMIVSYVVGPRSPQMADDLVNDVAGRIINDQFQLTTDGLQFYPRAVERAFGASVDFARLTKHYGQDYSGATRYSPAKLKSSTKEVITGSPDKRHISTSYVEPEPYDANGYASIHAFNEWIFKEGAESRARRHASLLALQLCADSQDAARDASDAGWSCGAPVDHRGNRWPLG
jgi:IS1 family transposase